MRWVVALLLLVGADRAAFGEDRPKAREAYRQATQHYDLGEYSDALAAFKEAYRNFEDPSFLFNIGQCHRQLGDKPEAIRFYRTYLIKVAEAPNREEVKALIGKLEVSIAVEKNTKSGPPQGTLPPTSQTPIMETPPVAATLVIAPSPAPTRKTPAYRKWWFWTAIVGGAAVVGGIAAGVALSRPGTTPTAPTELGTFHPF